MIFKMRSDAIKTERQKITTTNFWPINEKLNLRLPIIILKIKAPAKILEESLLFPN